jgi:predicted secreted protein
MDRLRPRLPAGRWRGAATRRSRIASIRARAPIAIIAGLAAAIVFSPLAHATERESPELELTAMASSRAVNDEMVVHLAAERSGADIGALNRQVLQALRAGLDAAKDVGGVRARSGSVTTQPIWDKDGKRDGWRVAGQLILEGTDLVATGELAGRLARDLQLTHVEFRLTPQRRSQAENQLIEEVAGAFRERARRATLALGYRDYDLDKVTVQTQASMPPPMPRAMRMAAEAAVAVPAEGGEATVEVTMTGTVRLR